MPIIPRVNVDRDIPVASPRFGVPPLNPALTSAADNAAKVTGIAKSIADQVDHQQLVNRITTRIHRISGGYEDHDSAFRQLFSTGTAPGAENVTIPEGADLSGGEE